jgi:hypothetical protein
MDGWIATSSQPNKSLLLNTTLLNHIYLDSVCGEDKLANLLAPA